MMTDKLFSVAHLRFFFVILEIPEREGFSITLFNARVKSRDWLRLKNFGEIELIHFKVELIPGPLN